MRSASLTLGALALAGLDATQGPAQAPSASGRQQD